MRRSLSSTHDRVSVVTNPGGWASLSLVFIRKLLEAHVALSTAVATQRATY